MRSSKSRSRSKQNRPRTLGNIINRVFDSSGPEGKVRGTPAQLIEKYQFLARDAQLSNDRVAAENFLQHAEHYTRLLAEAQREMAAEQEARQQNHGQGGNGNGNGQGGNGRRDEYRPDYRQDFREGDEQPEISGHDVIDVIGDEDVGLVATPEARPADQQRGDRNQGQRGDRDQGQRRDQDGNRGGNSNQRRSYPPRIDQGRPDQPRQDQGRQDQGRQDQPRDGNRDQARGEQPRRDPRPPRSPEKVGEKVGEKPVERAAEQPASLQVIEVQEASQPVVLAPPGAPVESPTPAPEQPALFSEAEAAPAKKPRSPSTRTRAPKKAAEAKTEAPTEGSSEA